MEISSCWGLHTLYIIIYTIIPHMSFHLTIIFVTYINYIYNI